jgi:hypothetical protein
LVIPQRGGLSRPEKKRKLRAADKTPPPLNR